jgi:hypothetical protein
MESDVQPSLYVWTPITHDKSIRLLTLHPCRENSDDIHITLSEVQLSEPIPDTVKYEALSYCWATEDGDDWRSQVVYCDGAQVLITKNCEAALRRLRGHDDRMLWIDAICINQSDDQERSSQVNKMKLIYTYASSVKVYLGEPLDDVDEETNERISDTTVDFLAALYAELKESSFLENEDAEKDCPLYQGLSAVLYSATREDLPTIPGVRGLRDILSRRWWHRVWVVQEAFLARDCAILWGEKLIPYTHICLFYSVTKWSGRSFMLKLLLFHEAHFNVLDPTGSELPKFSQTNHAMRILTVLGRVHELQSSDPRDKIFALSGVLDPLNLIFPGSDYTKSGTEIFSRLTISLIWSSRSLQALYFLPKFDPSRSPSWMVDWTLSPALGLDRLPQSESHSATSSTAPFSLNHVNHKFLKITGNVFDQVSEVSKYRHGSDEASMLEHWKDLCRLGLSLNAYPTGEALGEVLGRTLTWHRLFEGRDAGSYNYQQEFEQFHDLLMKGKSIAEIKESSSRGIATILQGTDLILCTTEKGYVGMVSEATKCGDKIVLLEGGSSPFVLRPLGQQYQIVGACYIHGIMNGEAWSESGLHLEEFIVC